MTQFQVADLWDEAVKAQTARLADTHTEWVNLTLATEAEAQTALTQWAFSLVYSHSPVKEALWDDLLSVLSTLNLHPDLSKVVVKETLARLAARDWQLWGKVTVKTPTDLLRLFAYLQGQDVSLATPIKLTGLKLSKPQRRAVVQFLNGVPALEEDLLRYKRLWVKLSGWLHPGDFAKAYPKVATAFDHLRNDRVQSFESKVAQAKGQDKVDLLQTRPSLLLRKLTALLQTVEPCCLEFALLELRNQVDKLPLPLLLNAYSAVSYHGNRLVINKAGKPYTIGGKDDIMGQVGVLNALDQLILYKLTGTKDWSTVWIDPALDKLVLPLQARKQSDGLLNLARGSRLKVPTDMLRLFVYWQDADTDLDLSALKLNQGFTVTGHVAFDRYGNDAAIVHSGDIQRAPLGATEFIDLRLDRVQDAYILVSVLRFAGKSFPALQACSAGWQYREHFTADTATFDAKTVAEKVNVNQSGKTWTPFIVDLKQRELIFTDLYSAGSNTIQKNKHFPGQAQRLAEYYKARPTYGQLAEWYVRANHAEQVTDRTQAAVTISATDDCTINVLRLVGSGVTNLGE